MIQKKYNISMKLFKVTCLVVMSFFVFSFFANAAINMDEAVYRKGTYQSAVLDPYTPPGPDNSSNNSTPNFSNNSAPLLAINSSDSSNSSSNNTTNTFPNPFKADSSTNTLYGFVFYVFSKIIMPIAAIVVVFYIIYAGFLFVKSRGNEEELKVAKLALRHAVIGAAVLLGALTIATAIQGTLCQISGNRIPDLCPPSITGSSSFNFR